MMPCHGRAGQPERKKRADESTDSFLRPKSHHLRYETARTSPAPAGRPDSFPPFFPATFYPVAAAHDASRHLAGSGYTSGVKETQTKVGGESDSRQPRPKAGCRWHQTIHMLSSQGKNTVGSGCHNQASNQIAQLTRSTTNG
jgi:hypothetical protein